MRLPSVHKLLIASVALCLVFPVITGRSKGSYTYPLAKSDRVIKMTTLAGSPVELTDVRLGKDSFKDSKRILSRRGSIESVEFRCQGDNGWLNNLAFTLQNVYNQPLIALSVDLLIKFEGLPYPISVPLGPNRPIPLSLDKDLARKIRPEVLAPGEEAVYSIRPSTLELIAQQLQKTGVPESVAEVELDLGRIQFDYDTGWNDGEIFHRDLANPTRWVPLKSQANNRNAAPPSQSR